jgi:dihydropteroate synthase
MRITPLKIESQEEAKKIMKNLGVTPDGIKILSPKSISAAFKIGEISSWEANIIKQHLLSLGSDCAINRNALVKKIKTSVLIFGNLVQLKKLCKKLEKQPFGLKDISYKLSIYLDNLFKKEFIFRAKDKILKIKKPIICGIINLTSDSFSGDGLFKEAKNKKDIISLAIKKAEEMIKNGAKIIDLGGESTRPFSKPVNEKEEIKRVIPVLRAIRKKFKNVFISIDTYKYKVAKEAIESGADIINDITALRSDSRIASLIKKYKLGCILMHMKGKPQTMQMNPQYRKGVMEEIIDFFKERLNFCKKMGIKEEQISIDPGIGFGKRVEDNLKIINELYKLKIFGLPIFLGVSRKSFIGKVLNIEVEERLIGTIASICCAYLRGASILRVHDVKEASEAINMLYQIIVH